MAQPRRTSTTKQTGKGLLELTDSVKNIQTSTTITPLKPRRPPVTRTGDITNKDFPSKRDKPSEPVIDLEMSPSSPAAQDTTIIARHRLFSEKTHPALGVPMLISLPFPATVWSDPDLKDMIVSETLDDLESTTRGDLQFYPEGVFCLTALMVVPDETGSANSSAVVGSGFASASIETFTSESAIRMSSEEISHDIHNIRDIHHHGITSTPPRDTVASHDDSTTSETHFVSTYSESSSMQVVESSSHEENSKTTVISETIDSNDVATPTFIATVPKPVSATPKRAVKLATASSAAADWFSKGLTHLGIGGKKEVREIVTETLSVNESTSDSDKHVFVIATPGQLQSEATKNVEKGCSLILR
jgi:hypothetical protein